MHTICAWFDLFIGLLVLFPRSNAFSLPPNGPGISSNQANLTRPINKINSTTGLQDDPPIFPLNQQIGGVIAQLPERFDDPTLWAVNFLERDRKSPYGYRKGQICFEDKSGATYEVEFTLAGDKIDEPGRWNKDSRIIEEADPLRWSLVHLEIDFAIELVQRAGYTGRIRMARVIELRDRPEGQGYPFYEFQFGIPLGNQYSILVSTFDDTVSGRIPWSKDDGGNLTPIGNFTSI